MEIPNPEYRLEETTTTTAGATPVPKELSLDVQQIVDLFSGPFLSINYQLPSHAKIKKMTSAEDLPSLDAKQSLSGVYHQFFYYHEGKQRLCPIGPLFPRIVSVKWDYESTFAAVQTQEGTINVLQYQTIPLSPTEEEGGKSGQKIEFQTIATFQVHSFHSVAQNPWNRYFWSQQLLWIQSYPRKTLQGQCSTQFTVYSFWKVPEKDIQSVQSISTSSSSSTKPLDLYISQKAILSFIGKVRIFSFSFFFLWFHRINCYSIEIPRLEICIQSLS